MDGFGDGGDGGFPQIGRLRCESGDEGAFGRDECQGWWRDGIGGYKCDGDGVGCGVWGLESAVESMGCAADSELDGSVLDATAHIRVNSTRERAIPAGWRR